MKVIFLDFDGVITTPDSNYRIMWDKVALVQKILDATGAKIVLSTSWRDFDIESSIKAIKRNPFNPENKCPFEKDIVGVTIKYGYSTKWDWISPRGGEINDYIKEHPEIEQYVIIDDEDITPTNEQWNHVVYTNHYKGITEEDVNKAIEILCTKE